MKIGEKMKRKNLIAVFMACLMLVTIATTLNVAGKENYKPEETIESESETRTCY